MRLLVICGAVASLAADWPTPLGPHRDGHSPETGFPWKWPAAGPPVAWAKDVGRGWAGVSVANGTAYLFHRVGDEDVLAALDPATGNEKWAVKTPTAYADSYSSDDGPRCTPVVAGDRVFALRADGDLRCVSTAGKPLWAKNVRTAYKAPPGYFGVGSGPLVVDDLVLVNVGGPGAGIVAFDAATGAERWKATDDPPGYAAPVLGTVGGKTRAVFLTRSGVVVLDPATGAVAFTKPFRARLDASVNAASPVLRDGAVLVSAEYGTGAAVLKPNGPELEEVWAGERSLSCHYNTPVLVGAAVFGVHGRAEGRAALRCVAWGDGGVLWEKPGFGCASLIGVDGCLLAVTDRGELVRFSRSDKQYEELGRASILSGTVRAPAALADGRLYARDESKLVCVTLK